MEQRRYRKRAILLAAIAVFTFVVKAQQDNIEPYLVAIGVKQEFTRWCDCMNSAPEHSNTRAELNNGTIPIEIFNNDLDKTLFFTDSLYNSHPDKSISKLVNTSGDSLTSITLHGHINEIRDNGYVNYTAELVNLRYGVNSLSPQNLSAACNFTNGNNQEGYTLTTTIIIDDPVNITKNGSQYDFSAEDEQLTLNISSYYDNRRPERPMLQVIPDDGSETHWYTIPNITIRPDKQISLSYEQIAGKKADENTRYYKWLGKRLKFRVVKTLANGKKTAGLHVAGVVFYPMGLQYTIAAIQRRHCDESLEIYVELEDGAFKGYMDFKPEDRFYWTIIQEDNDILINCEMHPIEPPLKYKIVPDLSATGGISPFENTVDEEWLVQLADKNNVGSNFVTKTFTVPGVAPGINISQQAPGFTINSVNYHVPDSNSIYAIVDVEDNYEHAALRSPYTFYTSDSLFVAKTDSNHVSFNDLPQSRQDSIDTVFVHHFAEVLSNPDGPYRSYFNNRMRNWLRDNPQGEPLPEIPAGISGGYNFHYIGDFFYYENNGYLEVLVQNSTIRSTTRLTSASHTGFAGIAPSRRRFIYTQYDADGSNPRLMCQSSSGTESLLTFNHKVDNEGEIFNTELSIVLGVSGHSNSENNGLFVRNLQTGQSTRLLTYGIRTPQVTPQNTFVLYQRNIGSWYQGTLGATAVTDIRQLTSGANIFAVAFDESYALSTDGSAVYREDLFGYEPDRVVVNRNVDPDNCVLTNSGILYYFYEGTAPAYADRGLYKSFLDGGPGTQISSAYGENLAGPGDGSYIIYYNPTDQLTYMYYLEQSAATSKYYPDYGMASDWLSEFREAYRKQWLYETLGIHADDGIKLALHIKPNDTTHLFLEDAQLCKYPFSVFVKVPPAASFSTSIVQNPTDPCATDGIAEITYEGGGLPAYNYGAAGELRNIGDKIRICNLGYGQTPITFTDDNGNTSATIYINMESAANGITAVSTTSQTCANPNGTISVIVGGLAGSKEYSLTNNTTQAIEKDTVTANSYTFSGLEAGEYTINVTGGTCSFSYDTIVKQEIFRIKEITTTNVAQIGGTGEIQIKFENLDGTLTWLSGVPGVFNPTESASPVHYTGVTPGTYNFTAEHSVHGNTCPVEGSFEIEAPYFALDVIHREYDEHMQLTVLLKEGNKLLMPSHLVLLNQQGDTVLKGLENEHIDTMLNTPGDYTLYLHYAGGNTLETYNFTYPATPITSGIDIQPPNCPGDPAYVAYNPSGGIDGNNLTVSYDQLNYGDPTQITTLQEITTLHYYIKDHDTTTADIYGNTVTIDRSLVNSFEADIPQPVPVKAQRIETTGATCAGLANGTLQITGLSGGSGSYQYRIEGGIWNDTTVTLINLAAGQHEVFLMDSDNGCPEESVGIVYINQPDSLLFDSINVTQTTCNSNNGRIAVKLSGGTTPYAYEWYNFSGDLISTDSIIDSLSQSGYYILDVSDANGCTQHAEQAINPSDGPRIDSVSTQSTLCYGDANGVARLETVTDPVPYAPWQILWSTGETSNEINGLTAGLYNVAITDTNGCQYTAYFEVESPEPLDIETVFTEPTCFGYTDGEITVTPTGGTEAYTLQWSDGSTTSTISELEKGSYSLQITDANGCTLIEDFELTEPEQLTVDLGEDYTICPGSIISIDGQDFATHQWTTSEGTYSTERYIAIGTENEYYLEVTNAVGCVANDTINVKIGNNALQADFYMASEAAIGDTLKIYEMSNLVLDSLQWEYDEVVFYDVTPATDPFYMLRLEGLETGIFNIGMTGYSGGCIAKVVKQVELVEASDSTAIDLGLGYKEPLITNLSVSPNPNNGTFTLNIELREEADIDVVVFGVDYGHTVDERQGYGLKEYTFNYQLEGLNSGTYVIMLTSQNERRQLKMVVQ